MSTAYGQSGVGLSLGANFDFGGLVGPFFHLEAGAELKGSRAAHTLLLILRSPSKVWTSYIERPAPPKVTARNAVPGRRAGKEKVRLKVRKLQPYWASSEPITFAYLRGRTWDFKADVSGKAWAGLGDAFDNDETGAAAGARLEAGYLGIRTRLADPAPRHFSSVYSSGLSGQVDDILEYNLERKALAWLYMLSKSPKAGRKLDTPIEPARIKAGKYASRLHKTTVETFEAWDTLDTQAINRGGGGVLKTVLGKMVKLGKKAKRSYDKSNFDSVKIIAQLEQGISTLEQLHTTIRDDLAKQQSDLRARARKMKLAVADDVFAAELRKTEEAVRMRQREARSLISALQRARRNPLTGASPSSTSVGPPSFFLDLDVHEGRVHARAGVKVVLPAVASGKKPRDGDGKTERRRATLTGKGGGYSRRIGFRFQSTAHADDGGRRVLYSTQDTIVAHHYWSLSGDATLGRKANEAKKHLLATMHYRSVLANWFDTGGQKHKAMPGGSGVSYGMSVLRVRLIEYARAARAVYAPKAAAASLPKIDGEPGKTEKILMKQLRVSDFALRKLVRTMPEWLEEELQMEDAFVLEAAFGFKDPIGLAVTNRRVENLFNLSEFKTLHKTGKRPPSMRLQSLRLRYRIRNDADRSRNLFNIGLNPQLNYYPDGENDPGDFRQDMEMFDQYTTAGNWKWLQKFCPSSVAAQLGIGVERVTRVGSEGIVTMHETFFPDPYDEKSIGKALAERLERKNYQQNAEYLVPPVQLFGQ